MHSASALVFRTRCTCVNLMVKLNRMVKCLESRHLTVPLTVWSTRVQCDLICSSAHQHTALRPHHSCFASTPLAGTDEWSSRLHVWHTNSLRQQHRRTYLLTFNSSLSMVVVISAFLQNTHCSTHTYHSWQQKFCCHRTACVQQFTDYYKTDHQLWTV